MSRQIIAIDGIDGSGKTRFAARLEAACKSSALAVQLLRIDDFRGPVDWNSTSDEGETYYSSYYDLAAADDCLRAFAAGAASHEVPSFDPISEHITGSRTITFGADEILILEGVFTLRIPAAQQATLVYLTTSYDEARSKWAEASLRDLEP
jgi:uridine kinase